MTLTAPGTGFMRNLWCVENLLGVTGNTLLFRVIIAMIGLISHSRRHFCQGLSGEHFLPVLSAAEYYGTEIRHHNDHAREDDGSVDNPPGCLLY